MGDASSVRIAIAEETTFGTASSSGAFYFRLNSESLKLQQNVIQSGEIDPTRQPAGSVRVALNAGGDIVSEHSLTALAASPGTGFDPIVEGACMSDWSTSTAGVGQSINISGASAGVFTLTDAATSGVFSATVVGQWLRLLNFDTNGTIYAHITQKTSNNVLVCEGVRSTDAAVTDEAGQTDITFLGSYIRIGTTKKSYTIEKQFTDLATDEYSLFTGMRVGRWSQRLTAQRIFENTFGFLGKLVDTTTASVMGTPTAKWATTRLNAVDHFKMKMEGAFTTISTTRIQEITFDLDNRLRQEPELGVLGSTDIGISTPTLEGTLVAYMTTADFERKLEDRTASKLAWRFEDGTRFHIYSFPLIYYTDGDILATGNDQSVLARMRFAAEPDTNGIAFQVDRLA
jgi:hypothetical protein